MPPKKFEVRQMMQWPDIKSDGVMIDGIVLRSEMSPVGPVRGAAEPVLWAAKSEVFTPVVFAGGSLLRQPPGRGRGSHSAIFCSTSGWKRSSNRSFCGRRRYEDIFLKKPHKRAQKINPYLYEVRGWGRSLRAADVGRPSPRSVRIERAPVRAAGVGRRSPKQSEQLYCN